MKNFKKVPFLVTTLGFAMLSSAYAYTPLTTQLDPGARGNNVTNLQTFFADNNSIYPEGLVTGYFGFLTKSAVQRFQANYGLAQVGRVGPQTLIKINGLINSGGWNGNSGGWGGNDGSNPSASGVSATFSNVNMNVYASSATFSWTTDEEVTARVVYNTSPITVNEGDINSVGFTATNGFTVTSANTTGLSRQVTISNLQPNTIYYYMLVSTDKSGNVSVYGTNNTFRTNSN